MKKATNLLILVFFVSVLGCSQKTPGGKAEFTVKGETTYDFGKIEENSEGVVEFEFKNTGKDALIITNVSSSCGCTVPTYPKEPIEKNKTGVIKVKYDTKRIGIFTKSVKVFSNAKNSPVKLIIKGEVVKK